MPRFKRVYLEITNQCNLSCSFCPKISRRPEFMTVESFEKILAQIRPYTDFIYLHVKGEPLLHPEIDRILDVSQEQGIMVNLTTNGTLIAKTQSKILFKPALRAVNFSLHSYDKNEDYGQKTQYVGDIISFIKIALDETNLLISLRLWNLGQDNHNNLQKQRNRSILEIIEREFTMHTKIEEVLTPGKGVKILERLFLNYDQEFKWPDLTDHIVNEAGFCRALRDQVAILVDGTVVPCCLDGEGIIKLGNVFEREFGEIICGERAKRIYEGFSNRKAVEELCFKCQYKERFNS